MFSGCIVSMGYAVGYGIDTTYQEHMRYLQVCTEGLENIENVDDYVFCHEYDISMRTTR